MPIIYNQEHAKSVQGALHALLPLSGNFLQQIAQDKTSLPTKISFLKFYRDYPTYELHPQIFTKDDITQRFYYILSLDWLSAVYLKYKDSQSEEFKNKSDLAKSFLEKFYMDSSDNSLENILQYSALIQKKMDDVSIPIPAFYRGGSIRQGKLPEFQDSKSKTSSKKLMQHLTNLEMLDKESFPKPDLSQEEKSKKAAIDFAIQKNNEAAEDILKNLMKLVNKFCNETKSEIIQNSQKTKSYLINPKDDWAFVLVELGHKLNKDQIKTQSAILSLWLFLLRYADRVDRIMSPYRNGQISSKTKSQLVQDLQYQILFKREFTVYVEWLVGIRTPIINIEVESMKLVDAETAASSNDKDRIKFKATISENLSDLPQKDKYLTPLSTPNVAKSITQPIAQLRETKPPIVHNNPQTTFSKSQPIANKWIPENNPTKAKAKPPSIAKNKVMPQPSDNDSKSDAQMVTAQQTKKRM